MLPTMMKEYEIQPLNIPESWEVKRNVFYDLDPNDDFVSEDDKFTNIYCQEDMLSMVNSNYTLDLGWYGSDNLDNELTGFMLVLFKGEDWNNCELFELIRTRSKKEVIEKIKEILEAVSSGFFDTKEGYKISETQTNYKYIGEHLKYSITHDLNVLIK